MNLPPFLLGTERRRPFRFDAAVQILQVTILLLDSPLASTAFISGFREEPTIVPIDSFVAQRSRVLHRHLERVLRLLLGR